jgi:hypothetical protein
LANGKSAFDSTKFACCWSKQGNSVVEVEAISVGNGKNVLTKKPKINLKIFTNYLWTAYGIRPNGLAH